MRKVWIVTKGDYSDKSIQAVFSSEEQAEQFARHIDGDVCDGYEQQLPANRIEGQECNHE